MAGSIRTFGGLLLAFGGLGGLDAGNDLASCLLVCTIGLGLMYSGVVAMNSRKN